MQVKILLVLRLAKAEAHQTMKKSFLVVALFSFVCAALLVGCEKKTETPAAPDMPSTNAPAAPK